MAYYKALNGESHNGIFLFCFLVLDFSFFQIILDGDGATSRIANGKLVPRSLFSSLGTRS